MTPLLPKPIAGDEEPVQLEHDVPGLQAPDGAVITEWRFDAEDLAAILDGARMRIYITRTGVAIEFVPEGPQ